MSLVSLEGWLSSAAGNDLVAVVLLVMGVVAAIGLIWSLSRLKRLPRPKP